MQVQNRLPCSLSLKVVEIGVFCYIMVMNNALSLFDQPTIHGLMRVIMETHYKDALEAQQRELNGVTADEDLTNAKMLEISLSTLIQDVGNAMRNGELTPFHGNYQNWLKQRGYFEKVNNDPEQAKLP